MLAKIRSWLFLRMNGREHRSTLAKAALTVLVVFVVGTLLPQLLVPDHAWRDWQTVYFHRAAPPIDPVVVEIRDDPEHRRLLRQLVPADRPFVAALTACIGRAEPRVIGIDILLADPSQKAVDPEVVRLLRGAVARVPVVLANHDIVSPSGTAAAFGPVAALAKASGAAQGNIRLRPEKHDKLIRRSLSIPANAPISHNFPDAMLAAAGEPVSLRSRSEHLFWWLPESFVRLPASTIVELCQRNELPALRQLFVGRMVLIGSTADRDRHRTPLSLLDRYDAGIDGLMIHANTVAHRLSGSVIHPAPIFLELLLGFVLALLSLRWRDRHLWRRVSYGTLVIAALLILDSVAFALFGLALRVGLLLYCFAASLLIWVAVPRWIAGRREGGGE